MRPKTPQEIENMHEGGKMLATVLELVKNSMQPGMSTKDLSDIAAVEIKKLGGRPSFLGHEGFAEAMCVSINEEIVHGVPLARKKIKDGDVVKLDFGVLYKGLMTDSAITATVGSEEPPADVKRLLDATKKSLDAGVSAIKGDGTKTGDIGAAVQDVLDAAKLGVVRDLVGHGVGDKIHEAPNIPNYGVAGNGTVLLAGMTICIEPMATLGDWRIKALKNGAVLVADGSLGAHFEHTVAITEDSAEILTSL